MKSPCRAACKNNAEYALVVTERWMKSSNGKTKPISNEMRLSNKSQEKIQRTVVLSAGLKPIVISPQAKRHAGALLLKPVIYPSQAPTNCVCAENV